METVFTPKAGDYAYDVQKFERLFTAGDVCDVTGLVVYVHITINQTCSLNHLPFQKLIARTRKRLFDKAQFAVLLVTSLLAILLSWFLAGRVSGNALISDEVNIIGQNPLVELRFSDYCLYKRAAPDKSRRASR